MISVPRLVDNGYSIYFSNSVVIKLNKCFIYFGTLIDGIYIINYISPTKIASADNLADHFMKSLLAKTFDNYLEGMKLRCITVWL